MKSLAKRAGIQRATLAGARMCCERTALSLRPRSAPSPHGRILCYHSVGTPRWGVNDVTPQRFERQLNLALSAGFRFVPAEKIAAGRGAPNELALTFDDGLRTVATNAAPVLAGLGIPWTLFVVSDWAEGRADGWAGDAFLSWPEIERLAAAGATIASHSATHPNFGKLPRDEMRRELAESRRSITARLGIDTTWFAYPMGRSADWSDEATSLAHEAGYDLIFAGVEGTRPAGTIARTMVTHYDGDRIFRAALHGAYDRWEEWL